MSSAARARCSYAVEVTDLDPGSATHVEAMIAGAASEAGFVDTLGIAPHDGTGAVDNAIVYAFARDIGDKPQELCETAAQEIAHAFTLDHELDCRDPMTYLDGCGPKHFVDEEIACGESTARMCWCGGTTQDSDREHITRYHCAIYDDRPKPCRDFTLGSEHSLTARRRVDTSL